MIRRPRLRDRARALPLWGAAPRLNSRIDGLRAISGSREKHGFPAPPSYAARAPRGSSPVNTEISISVSTGPMKSGMQIFPVDGFNCIAHL